MALAVPASVLDLADPTAIRRQSHRRNPCNRNTATVGSGKRRRPPHPASGKLIRPPRERSRYHGQTHLNTASPPVLYPDLCSLHGRAISIKNGPARFADSAGTDYYGSTPCADRVATVERPTENLGTWIHLLDEARETIDLSYYAMHMGPSTDLFLGASLPRREPGRAGADHSGQHVRQRRPDSNPTGTTPPRWARIPTFS